MSVKENTQFFSTQARILMAEWKALAKLIMDHSIPAKEKPIINIDDLENFDIENLENINFGAPDELPHIVAEKNIQIALRGPFGALLREKMGAYAKVARLRLEIHLNKEDLFKKRRSTPEEEQIPEKKIEKITFSQLDAIQNQLDELTEEHDQQLRDFIEKWTDILLDFLRKSQLLLTEREAGELKNEDTSTEILPRFIEVGLKLPQKEYPCMSCVDYLYLKTLLIIQSALSRQHLPHDDAQIQEKLRGFKSKFGKMRKEEQQLLEEQKSLSASVLEPVDI